MDKVKKEKLIIGWKEYVSLPSLGIHRIKAKVDTGATTSSLHAEDLSEFKKGRKSFVKFSLPLDDRKTRKFVEAELIDKRTIKSSNGESEHRYVIRANASLMGEIWEIELTLTDRSLMKFDMLLGRKAMSKRFVVDPAKSFMGTKKVKKKRLKKSKVTK